MCRLGAGAPDLTIGSRLQLVALAREDVIRRQVFRFLVCPCRPLGRAWSGTVNGGDCQLLGELTGCEAGATIPKKLERPQGFRESRLSGVKHNVSQSLDVKGVTRAIAAFALLASVDDAEAIVSHPSNTRRQNAGSGVRHPNSGSTTFAVPLDRSLLTTDVRFEYALSVPAAFRYSRL